ncbi:hypothetical protein B0H19DRAFT_1152567 [Mycena capillaripes]|nr:hypothetical protein B0H19DRAFT_1152567 [Mycena capillaripes]
MAASIRARDIDLRHACSSLRVPQACSAPQRSALSSHLFPEQAAGALTAFAECECPFTGNFASSA